MHKSVVFKKNSLGSFQLLMFRTEKNLHFKDKNKF